MTIKGNVEMALETLKDVEKIGGYTVLSERPKKEDGSVDWDKFDELRKTFPIYVDHDVNMISFRIQDGPIKENGLNGCQVDTLIETAKIIITELNRKFFSNENIRAISYLGNALACLEARKADRVRRNVEGYSKD